MGPIGYPKTSEWNYHFTQCTIPEDSRSQNMFNLIVSIHQQNAKWSNIIVLWQNLRKHCQVGWNHMTSQVKGLVLCSLINISVVGSKVPSSLKTTTWHFHILIPHKQNPHTKINQSDVTATILSQPGIQVCVASVVVQSRQTDFNGLHETLPWLVQHLCIIWTLIIFVTYKIKKNIPVTLWYMQSNNVAVRF
jgi:hypothetical protein